jgi:hypothetical protein
MRSDQDTTTPVIDTPAKAYSPVNPVPGTRDPVPGTRETHYGPEEVRNGPPDRSQADELAAMRARVAQLEAEAEARDAEKRRLATAAQQGLAIGGEPQEFFHHLADGTVHRSFGHATQVSTREGGIPIPVISSHAVPFGYDDDTTEEV